MKKLVALLLIISLPALAARQLVPSTVVQPRGVLWTWTQSDLVNGNSCPWSSLGTFLLADNSAGATAVTITLRAAQQVDGDLSAPDRVVSLAAGKIGIMGSLSSYYVQADGSVWFDSSVAVKFACMVR